MKRPVHGLLPALQVARIALAPTAISNIWLVVLLTHRLGDPEPGEGLHRIGLGVLLALTAAVALGLYIFGMTLNDLLDARRDRVVAPHRPLPSGRMGTGAAAALCAGGLLVAVAAALPLGMLSTLVCLTCAGLILFYNAIGKRLGGVGVVTLGFIRGLHMLIANPLLAFTWPVWLTMSHVIGVSAACHRLEGKTPRLEAHHLWIVTGGWAFATVAMITWMQRQGAGAAQPWMWAPPIVAAGIFICLAMRTADRAPSERAAGASLMKLGLVWLILYDAGWLLGAGLWRECLLLAGLLPVALGGMGLMRRAAQQSDALDTPHPPG